jgi:hypothetical protein
MSPWCLGETETLMTTLIWWRAAFVFFLIWATGFWLSELLWDDVESWDDLTTGTEGVFTLAWGSLIELTTCPFIESVVAVETFTSQAIFAAGPAEEASVLRAVSLARGLSCEAAFVACCLLSPWLFFGPCWSSWDWVSSASGWPTLFLLLSVIRLSLLFVLESQTS